MKIRHVGHAENWDDMDIDGDIDGLDCLIRFHKNGSVRAVATISRDVEALGWGARLANPFTARLNRAGFQPCGGCTGSAPRSILTSVNSTSTGRG